MNLRTPLVFQISHHFICNMKKQDREAYQKLGSEKSSTYCYIILLMGYARSSFRDLEIYVRIVVGLDEDDIQFFLKQNNLFFIIYELSPVTYTIREISEAVYTIGDHEGSLKIEWDDISMKTKLILTRFAGNFGTLRFDEDSFFKYFIRFYTILGFQTH